MVKLMERAKVGPKGQIVIPSSMRKAFNIVPGTVVLLETEENKILIERPAKDIIGQMEEIAKKGKPIKFIHPHEAYEEQMEERMRKFRLR